MTLLAGVFEALLSRLIPRLRAFFPAEVTGFIVTMVGISLIRAAALNFLNLGNPDMKPQASHVVVACITLATMVGLNVWGKGPLRLYCALLGIVVGYAAASAAGMLSVAHLDQLTQAPLMAFPALAPIGWSFDVALVVPFLIAALSSTLKAIGDLTTCQKINDADWKRPDMQSISRGVLADGLGLVAAGLLGGMGQSTSSSNVGLATATGATSRRIAFAMGGVAIALAFFPKLAAVLVIMPKPVVGAALIFVASFMIVSGCQIMMSRLIDARKTFVIGISLIFGLSVDLMPGLSAHFHHFKPLFSSSLALATVSALVLNLVFRLGISQRKQLILAPGVEASGLIVTFLETQGALWGARREVISRAIAALSEFVEAVATLGLTERDIRVDVSFDEFNLDVEVRYHGMPMEFATVRPSEADLLSDDQAVTRLAGFLIRHYADQITANSKDGQCHVQFHFDH
jgi:NCS2 family nucleobase:cation symporter-2